MPNEKQNIQAIGQLREISLRQSGKQGMGGVKELVHQHQAFSLPSPRRIKLLLLPPRNIPEKRFKTCKNCCNIPKKYGSKAHSPSPCPPNQKPKVLRLGNVTMHASLCVCVCVSVMEVHARVCDGRRKFHISKGISVTFLFFFFF